ncbi:MAG TPA: hypothetical protein VFE12_07200 [Acetobacteraceae bacterium]|jgi:hypothetical protein|nr:hypothetical protein [Acetobacteraceae bacterium]
MAPRKAKSTTTNAGSRPPATPAARNTTRQSTPATTAGDSNRLLREAAWSRMFGRIETKNPFTR